jgi:hypothetical protein
MTAGTLNAQDNINLTGSVVDGETSIPLSFASLRISGKSIGTVTNTDGAFNLIVPLVYSEDTLIISMMGYNPYHVVISGIKKTENIIIRLKLRPIQLDEVIIRDTILPAKEIITRAFQNIEKNYPEVPYMLNAFYRETHEENNKSVILVEAALDIYDKGYRPISGKPKLNETVNLKNARASKNYRHSIFKNTVVENYNLVLSALRWNMVKYGSSNYRKMLRNTNCILDSVMYSNDKLVYAVSFLSYIPRYPNFERKNIIHIDAENYAILKYGWEEYAKKGKYSEIPWTLSKDSPYLSARKRISTTYEYENYDGKMYLKYFDERCYDDILNKNGDVEFETLGHTTLITTGIETENINPENTGRMAGGKSVYQQTAHYDPVFWQHHYRLVPLTQKQTRDLEWEMPLEKQFQMQVKE